MACEDCRRREVEDNVDGLEQDVERLERVNRNQGILLVAILCAFAVLVIRLADKGVLSYRELLDGVADG